MSHAALPLLLLTVAVLTAALVAPVRSQSCAILTDPTCSQFVPVGTSIFVPGDPGIDAAALIRDANRAVNTVNFYARIREPCRSLALQLICHTFLRPCLDFYGNGTYVPVPQEPCVQLCDNYYNPCGILQVSRGGQKFGTGLYFPYGTAAPLNCSVPPIDIWAGNTSFYRANMSVYTYQGENKTFPCNDPVPTKYAEIYCGDPLSEFTSPTGRAYCAFTCPLPSLTDDQYTNAKTMQGIVGWFSWAGSTILLVSMLLNPGTRDFPKNLIVMTAAAANIAAGAIILPTYAGYDETWCGGSDEQLVPEFGGVTYNALGLPDLVFSIDDAALSFSSSLCTFQGAMLQFGFLAAVFWWTIIAFNMCLEIYFGKLLSLEQPKWKWSRFGLYNLVGWGVPFVLMVIPASAGYIKFSPAGTYCFVTTEDNDAWILTFWFLPVGICLITGVLLFIMALVRITIFMINLSKIKPLILLYLRLSVFIFLYLFLFVFIFAYNIQIAKDSSNISEGYETYFQCIIFTGGENCSLDDSVSNYNLVMLKGFAISSLGILLFFIFFTSWELILFWYRLFRAIGMIFVDRKPNAMKSVFRVVAYSTTTRSLQDSLTNSLSVVAVGDEDESNEEEEEEEEEMDEVTKDEKSREEDGSSSSASSD